MQSMSFVDARCRQGVSPPAMRADKGQELSCAAIFVDVVCAFASMTRSLIAADQFDFKDPKGLQPGHFALYRMHTSRCIRAARQKQVEVAFYSLIEIRMPDGGVSAALEKKDFTATARKYGACCSHRTLRVRHPNFFALK